MEFLNSIIDSYNIPLLTALLLGIMTSISPCPLATNITAIAYISKDIKKVKYTILSGLFYTLGRGVSYTSLGVLVYLGVSSFSIANIFEGWGDKVLGPILIIISLIMFGVININLKIRSEKFDNFKKYLSKKGYIGSLLLGILFALAFCPYSGVLFFGILIPLMLSTGEGLLLPAIFAVGTGLPVILFSFLIAISLEKVSRVFKVIQKTEKVMRYLVASIFMLSGFYYFYFLIKYFFI